MARDFAKAFYKSKEWQKVRDYCLKRDRFLCKKCSHPAQEVHHIVHLTPENITDITISLNPNNLICLCKDCHFAEHKADKVEGIRKAHGIEDCLPQYEFDENGYLVEVPPSKNL